MNLNDVTKAAGQVLLNAAAVGGNAISGLDVVWSNKGVGRTAPYLVFVNVPVRRTDPSMSGTGKKHQRGYFLVSVVVPQDKYETTAISIAEEIVDLFPTAVRLDAVTSTINIQDPPNPQVGFRDDPNWRLPVRIDYLAIDT